MCHCEAIAIARPRQTLTLRLRAHVPSRAKTNDPPAISQALALVALAQRSSTRAAALGPPAGATGAQGRQPPPSATCKEDGTVCRTQALAPAPPSPAAENESDSPRPSGQSDGGAGGASPRSALRAKTNARSSGPSPGARPLPNSLKRGGGTFDHAGTSAGGYKLLLRRRWRRVG
jgi:hypothetical protein